MFTRTVTAMVVLLLAGAASADSFGTNANHFTIDFVTISGDTNPTSGYGIVANDYRIGVYEITNGQWDKFRAELGAPGTGDPPEAYDEDPYFTGADVPANMVAWFEVAQFVNWLNTSTGHQAAYRFTGTQGQSDYTFATWSAAEADGSNLYRHMDAVYYLPTEDEWVKAAYWNGANLQTYPTKTGESLHQGDGVSGAGWNYFDGEFATDPNGPWDVGSGSEELNGTFDMMGNVWEFMESPYHSGDYGTDSDSGRGVRGGLYEDYAYYGESSNRYYGDPSYEYYGVGFRVASEILEPTSLSLLALGGLALRRSRRAPVRTTSRTPGRSCDHWTAG
jgi:formylglycine-generating enzyme required for sulfatase activity